MPAHGGGKIGGGGSPHFGGGGSHHRGGGGGGFVHVGGYGGHVRRHPRFCFMGLCCGCFFLFVILVSSLPPRDDVYTQTIVGGEDTLISKSTSWWSRVDIDFDAASVGYIGAYLFQSVPQRTGTSKRNDTNPISVDSNYYEYYKWVLPDRATLALQWSTNPIANIDFFVVRGDDDFNSLINDYLNPNQYNGDSLAHYFGDHYQTKITATGDDDNYYLVFINDGTAGTIKGYLTTQLNRPVYDVSKATASCVDQQSCSYQLVQGSDECVVIQATDSDNPNQGYTFTATAIARTGYYWALFGSLIGVWFLLVCLFALCFAILRRRRTTQYAILSETSTFVPPQQPAAVPPVYPNQGGYAVPPNQGGYAIPPGQNYYSPPPAYAPPPPVNPQYQQPTAPPGF